MWNRSHTPPDEVLQEPAQSCPEHPELPEHFLGREWNRNESNSEIAVCNWLHLGEHFQNGSHTCFRYRVCVSVLAPSTLVLMHIHLEERMHSYTPRYLFIYLSSNEFRSVRNFKGGVKRSELHYLADIYYLALFNLWFFFFRHSLKLNT